MENNDLYRQINERRLIDKAAPRVDMFRVMENLQRSAQFFNSYGLKDKTTNSPATASTTNNSGVKKPLTESNS